MMTEDSLSSDIMDFELICNFSVTFACVSSCRKCPAVPSITLRAGVGLR